MKQLTLFLFFNSWAFCQIGANRTDTPYGNFYQWDTLPGDRYSLKWGNETLTRSYPGSFNSQEAFPAFIGENARVIVLEGSCGRYCAYALVLPLDKASLPHRYDEPFDIDAKRNLIVFPCLSRLLSDTALAVENYVTGQRQYFAPKNCSDFASQNSLIAQIRGDSLYFQWQPSGDNSPSSQSKLAPLSRNLFSKLGQR